MTIYEKNGKYYSRFKIHGEQKHFLCQGAKTKFQAQAIEDAEKYKLRQQQAGLLEKDIKSISVGSLVKKYNDYSQRNKKSWTTDVSRGKLIEQYFGSSYIISKLKPEKIETFKEHLLKANKTKATVNRYLEQLSSMFSMAVDNGYLKENPCRKVKKFPTQNYTVRYLTKDEEQRLYEYLPPYLKPIVTVALKTGLRKSNILQLRWEQIDFKLKCITVPENKGNKFIVLPLIEPLYSMFKELAEDDCEGYVFKNPDTGLPYQDIKKSWNTALEAAGISNFRFHDLRHTVGTRLAEQNIPVNVIKDILAHSDVRTTMRYVHLTENSKANALSIL